MVVDCAFHLCDLSSTFGPEVIFGLSFSQSQFDSEGFSLGTLVFLPHQNQLSVNYIRLQVETLDGITCGILPFH